MRFDPFGLFVLIQIFGGAHRFARVTISHAASLGA